MNNLKSTIHALQKKDQHIDYVLHWLQSTFYMGESGSLLKATVYKEYCRMCERQGWKATSAAAFGKFVRKAFPNISSNRRGPRGSAKHHYRYLNFIDSQKNRQKQACVIEGDYDGMDEEKVVTTTHHRVTSSSTTTTTSPSPATSAVPAYYDHNSYYNPSVSSQAQRPTNFTQLLMQPLEQQAQQQQQPQHPYIRVPRSAGPVAAVVEQRRCSLLFPDPSYFPVNSASNQPVWEETTTTTTTTTTDPLKADDFVSSLLSDTFGCDSRRNSLLYPFPSSSTQSSNHVDSDDECASSKKKQQQQQQQQHSTTTPMQVETTPQLKAFKKAYQGYYAAILNAIMFKDDQCVRQEIHTFWVKEFPQHLATVPSTPEVREMLLEWDREGMNLLLELLSADARQMGSIEFADSLITVSCYLPIWVQTSAAQVLPKDLLIRQMSLWNLFSQAMYQRAHQMIHALQYPSATTSATTTTHASNSSSPVCTPPLSSSCGNSSSTPMMAMMNASPESLLGLYRNPNKQSAGYSDDGFESEVISPSSVLFLNASA